jgi:hypothetical protein
MSQVLELLRPQGAKFWIAFRVREVAADSETLASLLVVGPEALNDHEELENHPI